MPISEENLRHELLKHFPDADINLVDMAGDNDHWQVKIACDSFKGKSRIESHRMVQNATTHLGIHALSVNTSPKN